MLYDRIFPRWRPRPELRPQTARPTGEGLAIRWLGTAAHVVSSPTTTLLLDPFLTRPSLGEVWRPLRSDVAALDRWLPDRIDGVLCGHSHFDHLMDAPAIALRSGAVLAGSRTTCAFGRAHGLPAERMIEVPATGRSFSIGDLDVRYVPSLHGRILLGRVPFPGEVDGPPPTLPARAWHYRMGGAFGVLITWRGLTVYHNGSADLVDAQLEGTRADVLLVGLAGRQATPDYLGRLTGLLDPELVVPTHHDAFFAPLERGVHLLPGIDLDGFVTETRSRAPAARVVTPDYGEELWIPAHEPASAALVSR